MCGTLSGFSGNVQLLDSSRSDFQTIEKGGAIRCGDWVGTEEGAVDFKLASGARVIVGPRTFLQVVNAEEGASQDPIILYRGEVFVESKKPLSVVSANARLRIQGGKAVVLFVEDSNETQVVNLDGKMSFENRFMTDRPTELTPGYVSMFGANRERSVPNDPRLADADSLEKHLKLLEVPTAIREKIVAQSKTRAKTQTAVKLGGASAAPMVAVEPHHASSTGSGRMPASVSSEKTHSAPAVATTADHEENVDRVPAARHSKRAPAAKPMVDAKTVQKSDLLKRLSEIDPEVDGE